MQQQTFRALAVAFLLSLSIPAAAVAVAVPATAPAEAAPAARTLRQPIDWVPQNTVAPEDLPPLAAPTAEPTGPAIPTLYDGIGPGSALLVGPVVGSITSLCTAAFLYQDPGSGTYYLSTAGHCLVRNENEASPHSGYVDPTTTNNEVRICVRQCLDNALQLGTYVRLFRGMPGAPAGYDPVVFAQSGGIGSDFGLIRIPPSLNSQLRPFLPQFGGPSGTTFSAGTGNLIAHYGHGTYCCPVVGGVASRTPADQGRLAVSQGSDLRSFTFLGWSSGGDSGSGMSLAQPSQTRGVQGTLGLGVLTHGLITGGQGFGTLLFRGVQMAQGYQATHPTLPTSLAGLQLVKGSDSICLTDCNKLVPAVRITSPADGSTVLPGDLRVTGTVNRAASGSSGGAPGGTQSSQAFGLPAVPQAASLVHPIGGQDLYLHTTTLPVGNLDRVGGGADLVPDPPTSPTPSVSTHVLTTGTTEAVGEASWTYRGPVELNDATITVTWYGQLPFGLPELWEAHVFIGAAQIGNFNAPHAFASGEFASDATAAKTLTLEHVTGSGTNLVLMLRNPALLSPAAVLYGSPSFPSGIRVIESANDPPTAAFSCTVAGLTASCDASASSDDAGIASYAWDFGDGATGSGVAASHAYAADGTYTVALTVTDARGASDAASHDYVVATGPPNDPPTAAFACTTANLTVSCDGGASTDDGAIVSYAWDFGDGATGSGATVAHTYSTGGTRTVALTVTDDDGATGTASRPYTVTAPPPPPERVELRLDGVLQAIVTVDSAPSGDHAWNATLAGLAEGDHTLAARWLASNGTVLDTDSVTIRAEAPAGPKVVIRSPADGATVGPEATVAGTVNRAAPGGGTSPAPALPGPSAQAASLVHPIGGQDLYLHTTTLPVGNLDRVGGGARLVPDAPTSQTPSLSVHALTTGTTEAIGEASWTYHGPVELNDATITVTWYGQPALGSPEVWEAHVFIGAAQIGNFNAPHAWTTGDFAPDATAAKTLVLEHVTGSGTNLVLMLRSPALLAPAAVVYGSPSFPSGIRVVEPEPVDLPPVAAFACAADGLTLSCDASASSDDAGIASYAWDFGDGATGSGVAASHTYATAGNKTVTLTVTDTEGKEDAASRSYAVVAPPPPERVELSVDGVLRASVAVSSSTPGDHPWNVTLDLSDLPPGPHSLTARWLDADNALLDTDAVTLHVASANRAPTLAVPGDQSAAEGSELGFTVSASDPDGDAVTLVAGGLPAGAAFDAATGAFSWTPGYDQAGDHTVTFTADDGRGGTARSTVAIHVADTDRAPVLDAIPDATVKARSTLAFTVHASDPDGDAVAYAVDGLPAGAAFDASTGTFSWTPTAKQVGEHTLVFHASDGQAEDAQQMRITVTRR